MTRREKIEAMLADEPNDSFLRYSLAMELDKEGRHDESLARFEGLIATSRPTWRLFSQWRAARAARSTGRGSHGPEKWH